MSKEGLSEFAIDTPHLDCLVWGAGHQEILLLWERYLEDWSRVSLDRFVLSIDWVLPDFYLSIITTRDDFGGVSVKQHIIHWPFMPDEFKGSDLRLEVPHFDNSIGSSWDDLLHLFWEINWSNCLFMSSEAPDQRRVLSSGYCSYQSFGFLHLFVCSSVWNLNYINRIPYLNKSNLIQSQQLINWNKMIINQFMWILLE
jgi:hypothetical protein